MPTKKPPKLDGPSRKSLRIAKEGEALWCAVTKTVTPLEGRPDAPEVKPAFASQDRLPDRPLDPNWHVGESPVVERLDRKTRRKLGAGQLDIDRSVDLHGLTQDQAFARLKSTVESAVRAGEKTLLVVTGKGGARFSQTGSDTPVAQRTRADFDQFGGVLKRMVPVWLETSELKPFILSYGGSAKDHGGEGALYIMLRRRVPGGVSLREDGLSRLNTLGNKRDKG